MLTLASQLLRGYETKLVEVASLFTPCPNLLLRLKILGIKHRDIGMFHICSCLYVISDRDFKFNMVMKLNRTVGRGNRPTAIECFCQSNERIIYHASILTDNPQLLFTLISITILSASLVF
jgi:hypothetical protein